jgi:hypothetical protein
MLKFRTVFVLGAGASMPYKFPSGATLLDDAKKLNQESLRELINDYLHSGRDLELLAALADTQEESLDAMLEYQPEHIQIAGKRLIAQEILRCEHRFARQQGLVENDWIAHLFSRMAYGAGSDVATFFNSNDVHFVTYNYDRLIEYKLMSGLRAKYGANKSHWLPISQRVIHLHGSVGELVEDSPHRVPFAANFNTGKDVGHSIKSVLPLTDKTIKIVHEPKDNDKEFERARAVLCQADVVFFLGFGFGATNVDRLNWSCLKKSCTVRFTRYHMTDAETLLYIHEPFAKAGLQINIGEKHQGYPPQDWDCIRLLRENLTLLVERYVAC